MSELQPVIDQGSVSSSGAGEAITSRVVRGSVWSLTGQIIVVLVSFAATPFVIRLLGAESYGVLALINILIGYLAFSEFGMGTASTRFGAEAHARNDNNGEAAVIWTSLWIAAVPALVVSLSFAIAARPIVERAFRLPVHLHEAAIIGLRLAAVGFFARTISSVLNTPQVVRLRLDLVTKINTAGSITQALFTLVVLLLGGGLIGAVAVIAGVNVSIAVIFAIVSLRLLPELSKPQIHRPLLMPLLRFGGAIVTTSMAALLLTNAEKVLLTRYASVTALAHYSVAFALAMMLTQVPAAMNQSLLPAFSRFQTEPGHQDLHQLFRRALNGILFWVAPAALIMCLAARPFLTLWAGPEFGRESTFPFYILAAGLVINIFTWVPYNLLIAMGRTGLVARFHLAEIIPYVALAFVMIQWYGAVGAALAWSLRMVITAPLVFLFARRVSGVAISPLPEKLGAFLLALLVLLLPPLVAMWLTDSIAIALAVVVVSMAGYGSLLWLKVLSEGDRGGILRMIPERLRRRALE
jgi:O-antigen/teichoic acid export membrane protein